MLLVRLLFQATSMAAMVIAANPQRNIRLRSGRVADSIPTALTSVVDPPDQDHKTLVKCTKERELLAKELDKLIADRRKVEDQCKVELDHYRGMNRVLSQQVERLKLMVAERKDESDLPPLYKAQYTSIMCSKFHDGILMRDSKVRAEVYQICDGNKSLTECRLKRLDDPTDIDGISLEADMEWSDQGGDLRHSNATSRASKMIASPECYQAKALQEEVDSTQKSKDDKQQYCEKETRKLQTELEKKKAEENALWTEYHGHISQEGEIKIEQAQNVTLFFCGAVNAYRQRRADENCTDYRQQNAQEFYRKNCVPSMTASL